MTEPIKGKNATLYLYKGDDYYPFMCESDVDIRVTTEKVSVKTVGDGVWENYKGIGLGYVVNMNGLLMMADAVNNIGWDILQNQMALTPIPFLLVFEQDGAVKVIDGTILPDDTMYAGRVDEFASGTFQFTGSGPITVRDSLQSCDLQVDSFGITFYTTGEGGEPYFHVLVAYSGTGTFGRFEYSFDGGSRQAAFANNFVITIPDGAVNMEVWVICDTGIDGQSLNQPIVIG